MTYHSQNVVAQEIIFQNLNILKADPKACKDFDEPPLVVFREVKSIRDLLVRSRVSTENRLGAPACNRPRCETCRFVSQSCEVKMPRGTFRMTDSFTCTTRKFIYAVVCKRCDLIYMSETDRTLSTRFGEHY